MKNYTVALLLPLALPLAIAKAAPGEKFEGFHVMEFTCPLGGAKFKQDVGGCGGAPDHLP